MAELPLIHWDYREFELPAHNAEYAFLDWVREGWELIGIHPKGKGLRKPLPMALMRREHAWPSVQPLPAAQPADLARPEQALVEAFAN